MKKLITILALISAAIASPAHAAAPKVMVIIDTGVDIQHSSVKNNVIYEVCVSGYNSCPNKQNFMEGAGSATVTPSMYSNPSWGHGTEVVSAATQTDPNVKIIEIRCASLIGANGYIGCNADMLANSLNWVVANTSKYNIGAVVMPLGGTGACNLSANYVAPINKLIALNVPVMISTGNEFTYTAVDNPACLPGVLAISATDDKGRLALYANYSSKVDFAANGNMTVAVPNNQFKSDYGTSLSVAVFGADWLKIANSKSISYADEYNLIKSTGTNYTNIMVKQNVIAINMAKAVQ
jgi:hypothetical protein